MPWTNITRVEYRRGPARYPGDLTDEEWALIGPLSPPAKPGGRPRSTKLRDVMDGILQIASSGCQWRMPPKCFPPLSTGTISTIGVTAGCGRRSTIFWQPSSGNHLLATIFWQPSSGNHLLATIFWQPSSGNHLLATIFWQPSSGNHLLATIFWQPSSGNHLLVDRRPVNRRLPVPV